LDGKNVSVSSGTSVERLTGSFTIVLLSLIAFSFLRFHCQRGQQARRRQEELGDKQQHLDHMRLLSDGPLQPNGGPSGCVPEQYNLFMQYSNALL